MAADSVVKVNFLGDTSDIEKAAKVADDALENVEQAAKETDDALAKLSKGDPLRKVKDSTEDLDQALKKTKKSSDDVDESLDRVGKTGGASIKNIAAGVLSAQGIQQVAGGLMSAAKAAQEDEAAQTALAQTLKNVTNASADQVRGVEDFIAKTQNATGVLDDELRPAFDVLVRGTGDVAKSQRLMSLAMDVSAGTGADLTSVTEALSKAANGNTKSLKALNPALAGLIKDGASTEEVFAALGQTFEGQAAAKANTAAGQMAILQAKMADLQETIGAQVNKVILKLADILGWLSDHIEVVIGIGVGLIAGLAAWAASSLAAAIATGTLSTSMLGVAASTLLAMAPFIAIGVAVAALVAGVIYAYKNWDWFRDTVDAVAKFITGTLVPAFQRIGEFVLDVAKKIISLSQTFAGWVLDVWKFGGQVVDFMKEIPDKITEAFSKLADIIIAPFKKGFEETLKLYENTIGRIPGMGIGSGTALAGAAAADPRFAGSVGSLTANLSIDGTQVSKAMIDLDRRFN